MTKSSYIPKAQRATNVDSARYSEALSIASRAWNGPVFEEDSEGHKIRVWMDAKEGWAEKDELVRAWLLNLRAVEDLRTGLEFARQTTIDQLVREDYLRHIGFGLYLITAKAAEKYRLPKVMGKDFPK